MSNKNALKDYWDKIFSEKKSEQLAWYEKSPIPSLKLIEKTSLTTKSRILHIGAGLAHLVDYLVSLGFHNQIVTDISEVGLNKLKARIGSTGVGLEWIVDDLRKPEHLYKIKEVDLWHDRAVLHFLTNENDLETYRLLVKTVVDFGGYVIIAAFNMEGPEQCSGLPVKRYNAQMISEFLGDEFEPIETFDDVHKGPDDTERSYVYVLLSRTGQTTSFDKVSEHEKNDPPDPDVPF